MILVELLNLTFATTCDVGGDANVKFAPLGWEGGTGSDVIWCGKSDAVDAGKGQNAIYDYNPDE